MMEKTMLKSLAGLLLALFLIGAAQAQVVGSAQPDICPPNQTCSGSVTATGNIISVDTLGVYGSVTTQVTSAGVSTITYEGSNDNSTWASVIGTNVGNAAQSGSSTGSTNTFTFPLAMRYFRARVSSYTSGTVALTAVFRPNTWFMPYLALGAIPKPNTSGGLTNARVNSAATTNATSTKASAGQLYGFVLCNATASQKYFRFFNSASAPTPGSGTPTLTVAVRANGCETWATDIGVAYSAGIAYDITGANGDTDTTATAAADVTGAFWYN
jgi:hypothetical protein